MKLVLIGAALLGTVLCLTGILPGTSGTGTSADRVRKCVSERQTS